ncbi:MAG: hypothetical protein JW957_02995 [Candidatus Omnitrophica bacterium]|nr:hypothetical protein [Candidatus Omnitrophota bacterium]
MRDWFKGFLSGIIAVLIGFGLTLYWDISKSNREIKKTHEIILSVVREDLKYNLDALQFNQIILKQELEVIDDHKTVVTPLQFLHDGFWDLVKINLPKKLTRENIIIKIRNVAQFTEQINERIQSREVYRIHNEPMSNYHLKMKLYDQGLLRDIEDLSNMLEELQSLI